MATKARKHERERKGFAIAAAILTAAALMNAPGEAHKAITSKYTYNDDVFPILRDRCARCHVPGGVAPMSLMTYDDAFPWAESIRAELIAAHMPPWNADESFGDLKRSHTLSPKELDVILTWATGGNPRGALDQKLPVVALKNEWAMGKPDLALPIPAEFTLAADKMDDTQEFTLASGTTEPRWVRAVDVLPGTPSIVRSAVVYVKSAASTTNALAPEHILVRWLPGQDPEPIDGGVALRLPAGAELGVRIHYKKTWQFEAKPMTDRSTVGDYFSAAPAAQELLSLPIVSAAPPASGADPTFTFSHTIAQDVQALALSPDQVPPNITVQMQAVRPDGSRASLIRLNTRADWNRRYWFDRPIALPRGTRVEVTATLQDPDMMTTAFSSGTARPTAASPFRLMLNVVPAQTKPSAP
jgi:hypothetical protein